MKILKVAHTKAETVREKEVNLQKQRDLAEEKLWVRKNRRKLEVILLRAEITEKLKRLKQLIKE